MKLLLPPGEIAASINIQFENPVTLEGEFDLLPRQEVQPISKKDDGKWLVDNDFYRSSGTYPSSFKPDIETHFYNGCGIALSAFTPVRYIPSKREVIYYQRVIVTIEPIPDPDRQSASTNFFPSEKKAIGIGRDDPEPGINPAIFFRQGFSDQ